MDTYILRKNIDLAFVDREMPAGSIIDARIDMIKTIEAQRVDHYLRHHKDIVDRHNHALVAFHYLTPEAALWILPAYMKTIINHFDVNDFIIDVIFGVLSSCTPPELYGGLGASMRRLATDEEAAVVCAFCTWLDGTLADPSVTARAQRSQDLWCRNVIGTAP